MNSKFLLSFFLVSVLSVHGQELCTDDFSVGNDTTLYCGESATFHATPGMDSYEWNTGATQSSITVSEAGTYRCTATKLGDNVVVNGDFSAGNTGFTSDYDLGEGWNFGPLSSEGTYMVTSDPALGHHHFVSCSDHSVGDPTGKMMVVNGAATPGSKVWKQTITVVPNTEYLFSMWAISAVNLNPGELVFTINGIQLGSVMNLPNITDCDWQEFNESWNSGMSTVAEIAIESQNIIDDGNDFALDDISFRPICRYTEEVEVKVAFPTVSVLDSIDLCLGEELTVTATSSEEDAEFTWFPGELIGATQVLSPSETTTYYVQANVGNCFSELDSILVYVNPTCDITVPNVFTPNNDGINDFFKIDGIEGIETMECVILNRWGNVVFESGLPNFEWDGTDRNGNKMSDGTYFYKINVKVINGDELEKTGFVQLFTN